jgi:hypothetical protein
MNDGVWKLPELWTHRTRPRAPWKTHRTRFPQLPHASMPFDPSEKSVTYVAGQICYRGRRPVKPRTPNREPPNREPRTGNPEPGTEPEHEPRTENREA